MKKITGHKGQIATYICPKTKHTSIQSQQHCKLKYDVLTYKMAIALRPHICDVTSPYVYQTSPRLVHRVDSAGKEWTNLTELEYLGTTIPNYLFWRWDLADEEWSHSVLIHAEFHLERYIVFWHLDNPSGPQPPNLSVFSNTTVAAPCMHLRYREKVDREYTTTNLNPCPMPSKSFFLILRTWWQ